MCAKTPFFLPFCVGGFGRCCHAFLRHVFMVLLSRVDGMASARLWLFGVCVAAWPVSGCVLSCSCRCFCGLEPVCFGAYVGG